MGHNLEDLEDLVAHLDAHERDLILGPAGLAGGLLLNLGRVIPVLTTRLPPIATHWLLYLSISSPWS